MSFSSSAPAHYPYDTSTPPPPPPKPSAHSSGRGTPTAGPPLPPPPPGQSDQTYGGHTSSSSPVRPQYQQEVRPSSSSIPLPQQGWLPEIVKNKSTVDLHHILSTPTLQNAIVNDPTTTHPSLPASEAPIKEILAANLALTDSLKALEERLVHQRQSTQSRLLSLRALERQWKAKQAEQDTALRNFSPPALYQRLSAAAGEQDALCRGLEESFLEGEGDKRGGIASEREVTEFVRRFREGKKTAYLRRERKERWDEGRVGGWR